MFKLAMDSDFRTAITNVMQELKAAGVDVTPEVCSTTRALTSTCLTKINPPECATADGTIGQKVERQLVTRIEIPSTVSIEQQMRHIQGAIFDSILPFIHTPARVGGVGPVLALLKW